MDKYCYNGLLWLAQGEDVNIYDAESGDLLVEDFTLSDRKDTIELPDLYKTDSQYYVDDTNPFFTIFDARSYRKTVAGPAYGAGCKYNSNKCSPIFVSRDPEFVKYTTSDGGGPFEYRDTCEFKGKIWYIAGGTYGFTNASSSLLFTPDEYSTDWSYLGLNFLQHIYAS